MCLVLKKESVMAVCMLPCRESSCRPVVAEMTSVVLGEKTERGFTSRLISQGVGRCSGRGQGTYQVGCGKAKNCLDRQTDRHEPSVGVSGE